MTTDTLTALRALIAGDDDTITIGVEVANQLIDEIVETRARANDDAHYAQGAESQYRQAVGQRDWLRAHLDDILIVEHIESAHRLARKALDGLDEDVKTEIEVLRNAHSRALHAVSFFASTIKAGEAWNPACEKALRAAQGAE